MRSDGIKAFLKKERTARLFIPLFIGLAFMLLLSLVGGGSGEEATIKDEGERLAELCSAIEGVGECRIMLNYADERSGGGVISAAVIYDGGGGVRAESELKELISSLYGIGTNRIAVISSKKQ